VRSCCDKNNKVVEIRIGAIERFFNIKLKHKNIESKDEP
jgi:hypothetical protein